MNFHPQKPPQRYRPRGRIAVSKKIDKGTVELQQKRIFFKTRIHKKAANHPMTCWAQILFHNADITKKEYVFLKQYGYLRLSVYESEHPLHIRSSWSCEKSLFSSKEEKEYSKELKTQWKQLHGKAQDISSSLISFLDFLTLDAVTYEEDEKHYTHIKKRAKEALFLLKEIMEIF